MQPHLNSDFSTVTYTVTAHVSAMKSRPVALSAELSYSAADPYAVRMSLGAPAANAVDWVFARELLAGGTNRPTGSGDVLIFPGHRGNAHTVRVLLRNRAGTASVELALSEVLAFLRETFALVADGAESRHVDLDAAVGEITARRG
ncbi:SsgA family sporulation/cell division regulator [Streptomyces sp. NPDC093990]|uniref:SsgA family sporulation/cell division regulator n=1 Tax=Streptomyces sp. NPDC093990 TaxID=3155306 RepID=UPI003415AD24